MSNLYYFLERRRKGKVRSGICRDFTADTARAYESGPVAAIACSYAEVAHGKADTGIVIMEAAFAMIVHVACKDAPVRSKAYFEQSGHPVLLVVLGSEVLEFKSCGELRSPFI